MPASKTYRELFFTLFDAVKQAETELCQISGEEGARRARETLSAALDRCYEDLRVLEP